MGWLITIFKLIISLLFDLLDFIMPPGIGTIYDILGGFLGLWLWGVPGGLQFLEIIDFTDRIDGFLPTLTLAGIYSIITRGKD